MVNIIHAQTGAVVGVCVTDADILAWLEAHVGEYYFRSINQINGTTYVLVKARERVDHGR